MSRFLPRSLADGHPTVLFVGRISPEKGIHVLIDAFARVAERIPEARLEIVGPDAQCPASYIVELGANDPQISHLMRFYGNRSYFDQLREQVDRLGLAGRVRFVGALQHDEAPTMFQHATVLANTGFSEAFGMSLVEAMASSVPVVATRIGGMTELIEQSQAGLLCEAGDEKKLADGLLCLMKDNRKNKLMGMRGCQWVRTTCCWEQLAEQFFNHCRRMIHADAGDDDAFAVQADPVVSGSTEGPPDHD